MRAGIFDTVAAGLLLVLITGTVSVFAVRKRAGGMTGFERVRQQGGTWFLGTSLMTAGYWALQPVVQACLRHHVTPAALSWLSVVPAAAAAVAAASGYWGLAAWGLLASSLLDVLDGAVARAGGRASRAGAVLDSTLDRYVELLFFGAVLVFYEGQLGPQLLTFGAASASVLITYSTAKAEALHLTVPRGWMKRSDRLACLIAGAVASPLAARWLEPARDTAWRPWPLLAALAAIVVFGHLSAVLRFRALIRQASSS